MAAPFSWGLSVEIFAIITGGFWPIILGVACPGALLVTSTLIASLERKATLPTTIILGGLAGAVVGTMFILGVFLPYALGTGGRELADLAGDVTVTDTIVGGVIVYASGGSVVGAMSGAVAWASHGAFV